MAGGAVPPEGSILVFAGPSLPPAQRPAHPAFVWRGPAQAGDGLAALGDGRPEAFVLIDGLFDGCPAIRHKELLALIGQGVRVIGAASMGALRACELRFHGMQGVGRIYRAYAAGRLTGDDEVALLHGPAESGWNALSEPLVNVRATLLQAVRRRILGVDEARRLRRRAQGMHFADRTWEALLASGRGERGDQAFAAWLAGNRVDLKRQDALACLDAALRRPNTAVSRPPPPATVFTAALARALGQEQT